MSSVVMDPSGDAFKCPTEELNYHYKQKIENETCFSFLSFEQFLCC